MDLGATKAPEAAMIDRRSMLLTGAALGATMVLPSIADATTRFASPKFDVIDLAVWTGNRHAPARALIEPGGFLHPDHLRREPLARSFIALLSPANAVLFAEHLRFEPGVIVKNASPAMVSMALAHARIVMARWSRDD